MLISITDVSVLNVACKLGYYLEDAGLVGLIWGFLAQCIDYSLFVKGSSQKYNLYKLDRLLIFAVILIFWRLYYMTFVFICLVKQVPLKPSAVIQQLSSGFFSH